MNSEMTIKETQEAIIGEFGRLDDWLDRYELLIGLGKAYPAPGEDFRSERNAMHGCQSGLWLWAHIEDGRIRFLADSDSLIIRGVLALLMRALDDRPVEIAAGADLYFIDAIGLSAGLSPVRANGVEMIVERMRTLARTLAEGDGATTHPATEGTPR